MQPSRQQQAPPPHHTQSLSTFLHHTAASSHCPHLHSLSLLPYIWWVEARSPVFRGDYVFVVFEKTRTHNVGQCLNVKS